VAATKYPTLVEELTIFVGARPSTTGLGTTSERAGGYARRGVLWSAFRRVLRAGRAHPCLEGPHPVVMNPTVSQAVVDEATELRPGRALALNTAPRRTDVETFLARELVESAVDPRISAGHRTRASPGR
jgi:hypothetical protein